MTPSGPATICEYSGLPDGPHCPMSDHDILTWLIPRLDTPGLTTYCALRLGDPSAGKVLAYVARLRVERSARERLSAIAHECEYPALPDVD